MLLKFSVENFKSIKEKVTFDMTCNGLKESQQKDGLRIKAEDGTYYKKIAAIYGSNASGKSNFLEALSILPQLLGDTNFIGKEEKLPYEPFCFDKESCQKPTTLSFEALISGIRYLYSVSYNSDEIVSEKLQYAPNNYLILVYERDGQTYKYGNSAASLKSLESMTIKKRPFLLTAAAFNNAPCSSMYFFLKNDLVFDFQNHFYATVQGNSILESVSEEILENESFREFSLSFLQAADLNISSLSVKPFTAIDDKGLELANGSKYLNIIVGHKVGNKEWLLKLQDESDGTCSMLYLSYFFYKAKNGGKVIVVDELDQSLHTLFLPFLVEAFAKISTDSQIIFSLHDPSLMSNAELRRDEYYFTEKDDQAVTSIFSLSDFSVRRNVPIYDEYIQGRFGAIPFIKDGFVQ
jgi:uncharacterized protein